jgi:hypothetical protein
MSAARRAVAAAARSGPARAPAPRASASGRRRRGQAASDASTATGEAVVAGSGLSEETASRVIKSVARRASSSAPVLAGRIELLQRTLGHADADRAIRAFPQLLACRCGRPVRAGSGARAF